MLDLYCERLGPGLWAEPLNVWSNIGFLLAAAALLLNVMSFHGRVLGVLIGLIGIGSTTFHLLATPWAMWLDVAPIVAFQGAFLALYLRRVSQLTWSLTVALLLLYAAGMFVSANTPAVLNGSLGYLPALIALIVLGLDFLFRVQSPALLYTALLFGLSLTLRTLDMQSCAFVPAGTHFLWHLLNAVVLYRLVWTLEKTSSTPGIMIAPNPDRSELS